MKLKLVEDWKRAHTWLSMQMMALAGVIQGAWTYLPDDMKSNLPHWCSTGVAMTTLGLLIGGMGGRLIDQTPKPKPPENVT